MQQNKLSVAVVEAVLFLRDSACSDLRERHLTSQNMADVHWHPLQHQSHWLSRHPESGIRIDDSQSRTIRISVVEKPSMFLVEKVDDDSNKSAYQRRGSWSSLLRKPIYVFGTACIHNNDGNNDDGDCNDTKAVWLMQPVRFEPSGLKAQLKWIQSCADKRKMSSSRRNHAECLSRNQSQTRNLTLKLDDLVLTQFPVSRQPVIRIH